ncbi:EthD domain-containing protein [Fusarium oxysporum]|nr:EthD domain-containing protein [Fusarium oxysporum]
MQNPQPLLKVSVFFSKLDSIDHDTFFTHWKTTHASLASAAQSFKDHIVRYTQHRQTPEMKERARSLGEGVLEYDACAQLYVRTWDDWLSFSNSEEYKTVLADDCQKFMALPMTYMVGYESFIVGDMSA